jgi:hypothetical protein
VDFRIHAGRIIPLAALLLVASAQAQPPGRSDPSFSQPSLAPGVDYVVPAEADIKATLDRVRDYFVRSTQYRIIDTRTGQPIADFSRPIQTAALDSRGGQFNEWDYPMGVVLAGMLLAAEVTGDSRYQDYTLKNFDFVFDHLDYFRKQVAEFGPPSHGFRQLLDTRALDDCGAIGAALVKAYARKPDPRYRATAPPSTPSPISLPTSRCACPMARSPARARCPSHSGSTTPI